jgi:histidinol-phosphatase
MSDELRVAIEAARKAANYALKYYGKQIEFTKKKDSTVLTQVDKDVEEIIKSIIKKKFPDAKFVGEETGGIKNNENFWTIDPIDGTRHFIKSTPFWSVLISLIINGQPAVGVSYTPCLNETVYAEKEKGAYINNKKISVSKIDKLSNSMLMLGSLRFFKNKMHIALKLIDQCASTRSIVSPYQYHLLASGRCEIALDVNGKIWDLAPFKIIVEEAGGKFTNWQGKPWAIDDAGCIATNGLVHDEVMSIISKAS